MRNGECGIRKDKLVDKRRKVILILKERKGIIRMWLEE